MEYADTDLRTDVDRYKLHTYFPSCIKNPNEDNMYSEPRTEPRLGVLREKVSFALLALPCEAIHILGGKYYNSRNFSCGNELFHTFLELPRKTACLFLTEEVMRDHELFTYLTDAHRMRSLGRLPKLKTALKDLSDRWRVVVERGKSLALAGNKKGCVMGTLPNSLNCPRGFTHGKDDRLLRADSVRGDALCCVVEHLPSDTKRSTPLIWNEKIETKVLFSIRDALLETIKLILNRRVFETSSQKEFQLKSCDDKEIVKPAAALVVAREAVVRKAKEATALLREKLKEPFETAEKYGAAFKEYLQSFPDVKQALAWTSNIGEVTYKFLKQFYKQFIKSKYEAVLLRNIKKRLLETVCEYAIQKDILHFLPVDFKPRRQEKNYRKKFAKHFVLAYRRYKSQHKRDGLPAENIQEQLWDIFASKLKADENIYAEVFSDTLTKYVDILSEASLGLSDIFLNTAGQLTNEIIAVSFEKVFVHFFFTELNMNTDILEHIVMVFDVSHELGKNSLMVRRYPALVNWRRAIDSQLFGAEHYKERLREKEQEHVMETLIKTNFYISDLEADHPQLVEFAGTFEEFEDMVKTETEKSHWAQVPEVGGQLLLTDAPAPERSEEDALEATLYRTADAMEKAPLTPTREESEPKGVVKAFVGRLMGAKKGRARS